MGRELQIPVSGVNAMLQLNYHCAVTGLVVLRGLAEQESEKKRKASGMASTRTKDGTKKGVYSCSYRRTVSLNTSIPDCVQTRQVCPVLTHIEDIDDLRTLRECSRFFERGQNQWHDIVGR